MLFSPTVRKHAIHVLRCRSLSAVQAYEQVIITIIASLCHDLSQASAQRRRAVMLSNFTQRRDGTDRNANARSQNAS